ncbi:hypothetical protein [Sphingomonas sp. YL-JM2C]
MTGAISTRPHADPETRRATRLLAMVHELHKAGYQRLRICPGLSHDKSEWRCLLIPAQDVLANGWMPLRADPELLYTSRDGSRYFGWEDAAQDDARQLAVRFIERCPDLARRVEGDDWAYAGWFAKILGAAEHGITPILFMGLHDLEVGITPSPPPPPDAPDMRRSATGARLILNEDLRVQDLPEPGARYEDQLAFCWSFDGYAWATRTGADMLEAARAAENQGLANCSLTGLRLIAFARQREEKFHDWAPAPAALFDAISGAIEEVRTRLITSGSRSPLV